MDRHVKEVKERREHPFPIIPVLLPGADADSIPAYLTGHTRVAFAQSLDDDEAIPRLACYIRGTTPGLGSATLLDENECPYRGLQFFDVAHARYFFGRTGLTDRLVEKLRTSNALSSFPGRFLAIVGASGSGKSSLARAGLVAALNRGAIEGSDRWPVVISRPESDPIASLAIELAKTGVLGPDKQAVKDQLKTSMRQDQAGLHETVRLILPSDDPKRRLVILIDQFEELFTTCQDETVRKAFVDNLLHATAARDGRTLLVLAMRADFYGKCGSYTQLAQALSQCQELIGPMTEDELREAIERPAQMAACELEPGLMDLLVNEVADQPGSLPFLQFALKELWNKRTGRRLTREVYRTIGGVTGAAAQGGRGLFPPERIATANLPAHLSPAHSAGRRDRGYEAARASQRVAAQGRLHGRGGICPFQSLRSRDSLGDGGSRGWKGIRGSGARSADPRLAAVARAGSTRTARLS